MTVERFETAIIGGGQAGLAMSQSLTRHGLPHVVLERHRIAERWRSERWDSLRFQFPNWAMCLPDFAYTGDRPDEYAPRDDVVRFIEAFADFIRAPVRTGVEVKALRHAPDGRFRLDTADAPIEARNVVIATGPYQQPNIPAAANGLGDVFQTSASSYRSPGQLPDGVVLVVGAGASGCQIAEELLQSGRTVFLSVGPHRRVPRRYRGRDIIWWITALGLDEKIADEHAIRQPPLLISGANGGHTIDLRAYAAHGMHLLGRLLDARDGVISLATDLAANLAAGDETYANFIRGADAYVERNGLDLPVDQGPGMRFPDPRSVIDPIERLDVRQAGIGSVIWATGYRYAFDWVHLDVFAPAHDPSVRIPAQRRGVTVVPGAYFLGLSHMYKTKSSFLSGVGEDAAYLGEHIASRNGSPA